jgi:uncharacterized protein YceK
MPAETPSRIFRLWILLPLLGVSAILLSGCVTTRTTVTTTEGRCAAWRAITYSGKGDTAPTVRQIRVHNRTGQRLGCWK